MRCTARRACCSARCAGRARADRWRGRAGVTPRISWPGLEDPSRWLDVFGRLHGPRHSPLKQITPRNVGRLAPQWTFQTGTLARGRGFETTPLALDGVLYVTGPEQLRVGARCAHRPPFWQYRRDVAGDLTYGARARESRLRHPRRAAVHGDARRAPDRARPAHRRRALGRRARRLPDRLRRDAGAARRGGQSHRRHHGRRISDRGFLDAYDPDRQARLADLHGPRAREPGSDTWPTTIPWRAAAAAPG